MGRKKYSIHIRFALKGFAHIPAIFFSPVECVFIGVALKGFAYSYLFSYIERAFVVALLLLMLVLSCYLSSMLLGGNLYTISCIHAPLRSAGCKHYLFSYCIYNLLTAPLRSAYSKLICIQKARAK